MFSVVKVIGFIVLLCSVSTQAQERYTKEEERSLNATLRELVGVQKKCAVGFIQGYEHYTYPHCVQYNRDKGFCKNYKGKVPTSVIDTAFNICNIQWLGNVAVNE